MAEVLENRRNFENIWCFAWLQNFNMMSEEGLVSYLRILPTPSQAFLAGYFVENG